MAVTCRSWQNDNEAAFVAWATAVPGLHSSCGPDHGSEPYREPATTILLQGTRVGREGPGTLESRANC